MKILVTGGDGQLGRSLRSLVSGSHNEYLFTNVKQLDITSQEEVEMVCDRFAPDVIVNCAAYTNVERAEDEEERAYSLNAAAVGNLARTARTHGATLIHISTDYVFSGENNTPYKESAPVSPLSAYGRTKLAGEKAVEDSGAEAIVIRTAWLYSEFGNNFVKKMLELTALRQSVKVVIDQTGTPTYASDLAAAIFYIIEKGKFKGNQGVYHFTDEGVASWFDFATAIAREGGGKAVVIPCRSSDFPSKVKRPAYSVLDKSKFKRVFGYSIPYWTDSLKDCIKKLKGDEK